MKLEIFSPRAPFTPDPWRGAPAEKDCLVRTFGDEMEGIVVKPLNGGGKFANDFRFGVVESEVHPARCVVYPNEYDGCSPNDLLITYVLIT